MTFLKPEIEEYAQLKSGTANQLLDELWRETHEKMTRPQMLTGPLEASFLRMIVLLSKAKHILEIGMFTGYSALVMAEGLPEDGTLTTLEFNPSAIAIAKKYFLRSKHGNKIKVVEGQALDSLKTLSGPFDLVFIDADKTNYTHYYNTILPKMPSGGLILADNVLWGGKVLNPKTENDLAIVEFNDMVSNDNRVDKVLVPIRDGIFVIRKK